MPEEDAFAVFVKLMKDYCMRDMFKPSMAELGLCMYQLENLVQVIYYIFMIVWNNEFCKPYNFY